MLCCLQGGDTLKGKSRRVIRAIIILYLVVFGICFEEVRTERLLCTSFLCQSDETANSSPILTDLLGSVREDACTAEMLGGAQGVFFCELEAPKSAGSQRKPETMRWFFMTVASFLLLSFSYISVRSSDFGYIGNLTEIIHFIHNKDGKK
jgi:hypothetical protein